MTFEKWIRTYLTEADVDLDEVLEVDGPSGPNHIPIGSLVEAMCQAPKSEQAGIKNTIIKLDFRAAPIRPFLKHLAGAIAC